MSAKAKPAWVAVDWGTSNLRLWAMGEDGTVLEARASNAGMSGLARHEFEPALLAQLQGWLPESGRLAVLACGMVGSRQGWVEARYHQVPCKAAPFETLAEAPVQSPRISVLVVPGLKQMSPPDVIRGEETQIAGLLAAQPDFDGVACLPGTHTKWAQISAGEVVSFCTYMTGELFALLSRGSVLRHSIAETGWDEAAFDAGLADALARPEAIARRLFSLRAESLLTELSPLAARARLSGLLIGTELAAAKRYWLGQNLAIIGAQEISRIYARALESQGASANLHDATGLTLAGLTAAYRAHCATRKGLTCAN
ncbi:2-dehydro-3-deoxygalactonokinase [Abyssibius alkaniclasticus]|uniref:2-dehydro-3-deoxygalactonokinase n=1 Tax=Abyssibius alkaniclasticus TaxID=2881234 RepID=UPI0023647096|nr:2-dehydro-3-deoxygalactonokinase [Abyssibius alkaniclasticus]UPH70335.1 2-dehydro-3-deoxygalactonokinase [Abyssibius alkaniclasticus]